MTTVARLKVLMEADSHRLTTALAGIKRQVFNVKNALGLLAGAGGLGAMMSQQVKAADDILKFSERIGISTEALSELRHAATLSGVEVNALQMALQRMVRRLAQVATTGKGEAKDALERLGLSAKQLTTLAPEQQLSAIADAMQKVETQSERVFLAQKLFDSEGVQMLQVLKGGSQGLNAMREQARSAGVTLERGMAESAAQAADSMANLVASIEGLQRSRLQLAPTVTKVLDAITAAIPKAVGIVDKVGEHLGATAAMWAAILRGDFSQAKSISGMRLEALFGGGEDDSTERAVEQGVTKALKSSKSMLIEVVG